MTENQETVQEWLARGNEIKKCPTKIVEGAVHTNLPDQLLIGAGTWKRTPAFKDKKEPEEV